MKPRLSDWIVLALMAATLPVVVYSTLYAVITLLDAAQR